MCGGGGAPPDNSDKVAQIEADRAREERAEAERERIRKEQQFNQSLNSAYSSAVQEAESYFASMGLDPAQYRSAITNFANTKRGSVPQLDGSPGTYFEGLGESVFNREQEGVRSRALRGINNIAGEGFERNLIADTADDPFIASLLEEQYLDSTRRLDGQVQRGVLTDYGLQQSMKDLQRQRSVAGSNLETLTGALLETGRGGLRDIASRGRTAASNVNLGNEFDPFSYERQINDSATGFLTGLGDRVRSVAPTDLFDIGAAFQYGGSRQGLQANGFDADASAGLLSFFEDEDKKKKPKAQTESTF